MEWELRNQAARKFHPVFFTLPTTAWLSCELSAETQLIEKVEAQHRPVQWRGTYVPKVAVATKGFRALARE